MFSNIFQKNKHFLSSFILSLLLTFSSLHLLCSCRSSSLLFLFLLSSPRLSSINTYRSQVARRSLAGCSSGGKSALAPRIGKMGAARAAPLIPQGIMNILGKYSLFLHFLSFSFSFSQILSVSLSFSQFLSFSFIFLHFPSFSFMFFHVLSFSFVFFLFSVSFSFFQFLHFLSFSFIFLHVLSFSFIFFQFLSGSFIFFHVRSLSFIFFQLLSVAFSFFQLLSVSFIFFHIFIFC